MDVSCCVPNPERLVRSRGSSRRRHPLAFHGLAPSEIPKQKKNGPVAVLDDAGVAALLAAGSTDRWRVALALAGYGGLRLGEVRGLRWKDIDLAADLIHVRRSLLPDGTAKSPKTEAAARPVPILPALRKRLVAWRLRSPHARPADVVICTAEGRPVQERNLRRALDAANGAAGRTRSRGGTRGTRSGTRSLRRLQPT